MPRHTIRIAPSSKSVLKPGTVCVAVDGCAQNVGLLVKVVEHIGQFRIFPDVYLVKTLSGRVFNQVVQDWKPVKSSATVQYAQRHQLAPIVDGYELDDEVEEVAPAERDWV